MQVLHQDLASASHISTLCQQCIPGAVVSVLISPLHQHILTVGLNCRYTLTIDVDGTNLWKVPVVGTINGTVSCGHGGLMLLSEPTGTHLAVDKVEAWQLDTAAIFDGIASACRFHPNNDRSGLTHGL